MPVEFQPAPTWANPMIETVDPASGERKAVFNPVWLKWFLDLTSVLTSSGAGSGTIRFLIPAMEISFGDGSGVNSSSDKFRWDDAILTLFVGVAGTGGKFSGVQDSLGGAPGLIHVLGGSGAGDGGDINITAGQADPGTSGNVVIQGGANATSVGGDVSIEAGLSTGGNGNILLLSLPTAAPAISGALWRDAAAGNVVKCVP